MRIILLLAERPGEENTSWQPGHPIRAFIPRRRMAMTAATETLAYVAAFDPSASRRMPSRWSMSTPTRSPTRGVGTTAMPNAGDELHHFGWNACSSCLCPNAPHPHAERRYLVVPGLSSSRIHILDTKPDPGAEARQDDRAAGAGRKGRLHAARTPCIAARKASTWPHSATAKARGRAACS